MEENKKEQDLHLQPPGEANREKHINFLKEEEESARQEAAADNLDTPFFTATNNPYQRLNDGSVAAAVRPLPDEEVERQSEDNQDNENSTR